MIGGRLRSDAVQSNQKREIQMKKGADSLKEIFSNYARNMFTFFWKISLKYLNLELLVAVRQFQSNKEISAKFKISFKTFGMMRWVLEDNSNQIKNSRDSNQWKVLTRLKTSFKSKEHIYVNIDSNFERLLAITCFSSLFEGWAYFFFAQGQPS